MSIELSDEMIKKIAKGFPEYLKKKDEERRQYFRSEEFNKLVEIIGQHQSISHERLKYNLDSIDGLTAKDFGNVCNAVFHNIPWVTEKGKEFPTYYTNYKDIRFHLSVGQGSAYWTSKIK